MKKSSFVAMMLSTVSGVMFSLGMCMALLPEWNSFNIGVIFGVIGIILGFITFAVWRKMEKKAPIRFNGRMVAIWAFGIMGALILGVGMCFCMVWNNIVVGTIVGLVGILLLLSLIPMTKGIK